MHRNFYISSRFSSNDFFFKISLVSVCLHYTPFNLDVLFLSRFSFHFISFRCSFLLCVNFPYSVVREFCHLYENNEFREEWWLKKKWACPSEIVNWVQIGKPNAANSAKPAVWLDGGNHAREWPAFHVAVYFIEQVSLSAFVLRSSQIENLAGEQLWSGSQNHQIHWTVGYLCISCPESRRIHLFKNFKQSHDQTLA